ncbi:calcium-binding protein [Pseudoroseomonas wenyumeiae]
MLGTDAADLFLGGAGDDHLVGRGGNDDLRGDEGDDWLEGGEGDDTLRGGAGDDRIDGGAGFDRAVMDGLTFYGSGRALSTERLQLTTAEGTDTLSGVEEVRFLDGRLVLDAEAPEALVARLYAMALGRAPEAHGQGFWSTQWRPAPACPAWRMASWAATSSSPATAARPTTRASWPCFTTTCWGGHRTPLALHPGKRC